MKDKRYVGLDEDLKQGVGPTAKIILDARVFGLIPDDETCANWNAAGIQTLYDKVSAKWEEHGYLPSRLPDALRDRHSAVFEAAVATARANGWNPDSEIEGEG